jgi:exosortase E/protease (VPEID-CTERM system)
LKALLVTGALWLCRASYGAWRIELSGVAVAVGLLVGAAWVATAPVGGGDESLALWLTETGPVYAALWLAVRGLGAIVLVPVAEELAFRGYLYRRLQAHNFHEVSPATLSWLALALSSTLFGALHDRWLAGALAGAVFALVMLRRGRLGEAVTAHATANALIFVWALAARHWSLL